MPLLRGVRRALLRLGLVVVGDDTTPPNFSSGEEGDVTNATVAVTFSEAIVSALDDYVTGITIKVNGVSATISSGTLQSGSQVVYYVLDAGSAADANDEITWEYSDTLGDLADEAANQMGDVAASAITNNVGEHLRFNDAPNSMHLATVGL